jgi:hypothetical protein
VAGLNPPGKSESNKKRIQLLVPMCEAFLKLLRLAGIFGVIGRSSEIRLRSTVCFSATAHADLHARLAATVWRRRERSRCRCEVRISQSNSNCSCFVSQIPSLVSDSETAAAIDQIARAFCRVVF